MEKSPRYYESLQAVKQLPQETAEQKAEKKEQAKLFRMEVLLDNAHCAQLLTSELENNPALGKEEFARLAEKSGLLAHPETVEKFINNLVVTRENVEWSGKQLRRSADRRRVGIGRELYQWALPHQAGADDKPKGEVEADRSYPLALILYVGDDGDFERIDARKNVGGFYQAVKNRSDDRRHRTWAFPFIAVRGVNPKRYLSPPSAPTEQHEKGHAEHRKLIDTLRQRQKKTVWGRFDFPLEHLSSLLKEWEANPEQTRLSSNWQEVMDYALACAKDELLAAYKAYQGEMAFKLASLKERGSLYDYFANRLQITPDSSLYQALWQEYEAELEKAQNAAQEIITNYYIFGLNERKEIFRWVLAQIPLADWDERLNDTLFKEEAKKLGKAHMVGQTVYFGPSHEAIRHKKLAYTKLREQLHQNQHRPFLPYLKEFSETIKKEG